MLKANQTFNPDDPLWEQLSDSIRINMGLNFSKRRRLELYQGMKSAASAFDLHSAEELAHQLLSITWSQNLIEILAKYLTVGETYFFRDWESFEVLKQEILPALIEKRLGSNQRLRIWSAGCCSGEEAYSIAILLSKLIPDRSHWNITLLATDIVMEFLHKASKGIYNSWSFRNILPEIQETYFKKIKTGHFAIASEIKEMVTFSYHNLVEDNYPSIENNTNAMDIILCRNVLMYFEQSEICRVIKKLTLSLSEGGLLLLSPMDFPQVLQLPNLVPVYFNNQIIYRKDSRVAIPAPSLMTEIELSRVQEQGEQAKSIPEKQKQKTQEPHEISYQMAEQLYHQGAYNEADEMAKQILTQHPLDTMAMILLARSYANQGHLSNAQHWCQKALEIDKLNTEWWHLYATICQEEGLIEKAVIALKHALFLDQNNAIAHFSLGNLYRTQGKQRDAERHYKNAIEILTAYPQLTALEGLSADKLAEFINTTMMIKI